MTSWVPGVDKLAGYFRILEEDAPYDLGETRQGDSFYEHRDCEEDKGAG